MSSKQIPSDDTIRRPRIAVVGPTLPYTSGIAQYTSQLAAALRKIADTQTYSFKRQYPGWLYPGKTGYKLEPGMALDPEVHYTLDIYHPLSWRRTADNIVRGGAEVVVLDWWTLILQPGFTYVARRLRKRGVTVVYLCHNLFNHKTGGVMGLVDAVMGGAVKWMLRQADAYVVQSSEKQAQLRQFKPGAPVLFRLHPIYDRFPASTRHLPQRGRLELLFFGLIRPYKGLDVLVHALGRLKDKEVYLTVAGQAWDGADALTAQIEQADLAQNTELHLEYVSDEDAADYFERADVVVAPYRSATGSGVAAVAYNYGKPVVASAVGGLKDAVEQGKTGWQVQPESAEALAQAIAGITRETAAGMRDNIAMFCKENSWDAMAQAICDLGYSARKTSA
jgi:glycosyltransferase involved in cell wall biosynthesis